MRYPYEGLYQIACTAKYVNAKKKDGPWEGRAIDPEVMMLAMTIFGGNDSVVFLAGNVKKAERRGECSCR